MRKFMRNISGLILAAAIMWTGGKDQSTLNTVSGQAFDDARTSPVCPGRPFSVQPTETTVKNTGLSLEVLCIVGGTYLERDLPGPREDPDLLRRYLEQPPYDGLSDEAYVAKMDEAVQRWPESRFAHAGLARAILRGHREPTLAAKRRAAPEYLRAAEIAFAEGKVRYIRDIADLLGDLGDRDGLNRYLAGALKLTRDQGEQYALLLYGGRALGKAGNESAADLYLRKAIEIRPVGTWEAYELYIAFLFEKRRPQHVLELLSPALEAQNLLPAWYLHNMRCRALTNLGRQDEARTECDKAQETPGRQSPLESSPAVAPRKGLVRHSRPQRADGMMAIHATETVRGGSSGMLRRGLGQLLDSGSLLAAHSGTDDCRTNNGCSQHPEGWKVEHQYCYYYFTWNLAELIENEGLTESFGSRAAIGWAVHNRVVRKSTPDCGGFAGANGTCTSICPDPTYCAYQKSYCCVIHSGAFVDTHRSSVSIDNLELAREIIEGYTPEPMSGYIHPGASSCTTGVCDNRLYCFFAGNPENYAPDGPLYFYGNYVNNNVCRGFQTGPGLVDLASSCAVVGDETCGNGGSDNCYGRATRNRTWNAAPDFVGGGFTNGLAREMSSGGTISKIPSETPRFKNPGGKEFVVRLRLQVAGSANVRVRLRDAGNLILHDFGTLAVTSTTYEDKVFTSDVVVTGNGYQVQIINEGPGAVYAERVIARD